MKRGFLEKLKQKIIFWLVRRLPDCKTITPKLGKALDKKLSRREKIITNLHLYTCEACADYIKQIKFIRELFEEQEKYFQSINNSLKLNHKSRERIKKALLSAVNPVFI